MPSVWVTGSHVLLELHTLTGCLGHGNSTTTATTCCNYVCIISYHITQCFQDGVVGGTQYKKLVCGSEKKEAELFIQWLEKGVFDALTKKYLSTVFLEVFENIEGQEGNKENDVRVGTQCGDSGIPLGKKDENNHSRRLLEVFSFEVSYPVDSDGPEFRMSRSGPRGGEKDDGECSRENIKQNTASVLRRLVELASTLAPLPDDRVISMKLLYTDDTPKNYEPPLFCAAPNDSTNCWFENRPLRLSPGKVRTPYHELMMHIRTQAEVPDPTHNENEITVDAGTDREDEVLPSQNESEESDVMNVLATQTQMLDVGKENTARLPLSGDALDDRTPLTQVEMQTAGNKTAELSPAKSMHNVKVPASYSKGNEKRPTKNRADDKRTLQEKAGSQNPSLPSFAAKDRRRKISEIETPIQQRPRKRRNLPKRSRNAENVSSCQ